jgi:NitT/TauT family transport system substrate-binding protein
VRRRALLRSGLAVGMSVIAAEIATACGSTPATTASTTVLGPPEASTVRLAGGGLCDPAFWTAGDFLREEGFTNVKILSPSIGAVVRGEADVGTGYTQWIITNADAGSPMVALAGMHTGCGEVWTKPGISSVADLRGRTIAVNSVALTDVFYGFWATILAYVGIDARRDVNFVVYDTESPLELFLQGRSDAILVLAQSVPLLRASDRNRGKLLISAQDDKPWSQYYCCQLVANRDWARANPNAAKRVTRAVLRASDRVAKDPAFAARSTLEQGLISGATMDLALATFKNCTFQWRDLDAEESLRFSALQLAGQKLVKSSPQQLVARASDFAYVAELKKELKA